MACFLCDCADDLSIDSTPASLSVSEAPAAVLGQSAITMAEFTGSFDQICGDFSIAMLPSDEWQTLPSGVDPRTLDRALGFCDEFILNSGGESDFRMDTVAGFIGSTAEDCLSPAELADWGTLFFN
ncbi:MAG: hypothetical protein ACJAYU_004773 [Bradymonadia bacterium]|jgi:hypothetical protein